MAEESFSARVTKIEAFGIPGIIVHVFLDNDLSKALKTGISSNRGGNKCGIPVNSEVLVITNSPFPSKIDAKECGKCKFTTARGAKPPLVW